MIDLGGHEHVLAPQAGGAQPVMQPLTDLGLVAVALGGVDVAIAERRARSSPLSTQTASLSVMVPSPMAGIFAPLASTKFMACFPHSEAPARACNSRGRKAQS